MTHSSKLTVVPGHVGRIDGGLRVWEWREVFWTAESAG